MFSKINSKYLVIILIFFFSCKGAETVSINSINQQKKPKYIFLFIGDGMGANHVSLTEAYLSATKTGKMSFEDFPIHSDCTTYCKNRIITDSGAAGSAIACGEKANEGAISFYPQYSQDSMPLSIAKIAHKNGMKVGIISTVSINHATPAAFYAQNERRSNYYEIGYELPESGFEFFGGGGLKNATGKKGDKSDLYQRVTEFGYLITDDISTIASIDTSITGVYFVNPILLSDSDMPYAIDLEESGGVTLKDIVREAINYLDNPNGFFIMAEGGKIDWAAHDNDAATIVQEVIDFDKAVMEAVLFYNQHPDETLIMITADHETGGVSLGNYANAYESNFGILSQQKSSVNYFSKILDDYKQTNKEYLLNEVIALASEHFFNEDIKFSDEEMIKISKAFDYYFYKKSDLSAVELYNNYESINPLAIIFSKILSSRAGVGFTTWSHTAAKVPVYSQGKYSDIFNGGLDNTDFYKRLVELMNW